MFFILPQPFGDIPEFKLYNDSTKEYATVIPSYGATLNELVLKKGTVLFNVIDGSPNEGYLEKEGSPSYKGALLFPYPNRIKGGLYTFEGKMYRFDINEQSRHNALHGFCSKAKFEVIKQETNKSKASLELSYKIDGMHPAYPFNLELSVIYTLTTKGLQVESIVKNLGLKTAPVGLGWHPYFKTGTKIDDLEVWFPPHYNIQVDENLIPTGKKTKGFNFVSYEILGDTFIDGGYMIDTALIQSSIKIKDPIQNVTIDIGFDKGFGFLQIFTHPNRQSIAIEPQTCAADAFNNKLGLVELQPGEKRNFIYSVALH